jgi:cysteine desulfurase family protein (TIGR01976 family)
VSEVNVSELEAFRARFPALTRQHNGHPVAYFDGPGGTQVPQDVVDAMADYLLHHNANTDWAYPTSHETDVMIAGARAALADFVGGSPDEIAFGANMTTLTFHVSRALGRAWGAGDTIVVTELDHHANIDPWRAVAKDRGSRIEMVRLDPESGELDGEALDRALALRPRLVAITAASNALGTMPDVACAAQRARAAGALVFVDGVHYAPHALVDVHALGCDFFACSAYKFYGPHIGALWGRKSLLESLDVPKVRPAHDNAPDRIETGTLNHEGIAGAGAVVDFLASFGHGETRRARLASAYRGMHERAAAAFRGLWDGLGAVPGVTRYGPEPDRPRSPTVSFTLDGVAPADVARRLAERGVFVSHGDFYASTVAERMQCADGFVRAGLSGYSTPNEIERLLSGVRDISAGA